MPYTVKVRGGENNPNADADIRLIFEILEKLTLLDSIIIPNKVLFEELNLYTVDYVNCLGKY